MMGPRCPVRLKQRTYLMLSVAVTLYMFSFSRHRRICVLPGQSSPPSTHSREDLASDSSQPDVSPLSIVHLAASPLAAQWTDPPADLASLGASRHHVVIAGHSRLRHPYLQLLNILPEMRPLTRSQPRPPAADIDMPAERGGINVSRNWTAEGDADVSQATSRPPPPAYLPGDNSTCIAVFPKPHKPRRPIFHWCSRAARFGNLLVDFRWRRNAMELQQLLMKMWAASPDIFLMSYGLYDVSVSPSIMTLREQQETMLPQLLRLKRARGTRVVAALEQTNNNFVIRRPPVFLEDGHMVANVLIHETMLRNGLEAWSSHLPLVSDWELRICARMSQLKNLTEDTLMSCRQEEVHTDYATNRRKALQLMGYMRSVL